MELLHVQIMLCYAIDLLRAVTEDCKLQLILRPSRDANEDIPDEGVICPVFLTNINCVFLATT